MSTYTDAFDMICGNCAGLDIHAIDADAVRAQAAVHIADGEPLTEDDIEAAIRGLLEYQSLDLHAQHRADAYDAEQE
jgi:hypothetical protein